MSGTLHHTNFFIEAKKSVYLYLDVEEEIILEMGLIHMSVHGVNGTKLCMLQAICVKKMSLLFLIFIN